MADRTQRIAELNDQFRTTGLGGQIVMTQGVSRHQFKEQVLAAVREFGDFTEANDPHGEHDFGAVTVDGETFFWKVDYCDLSMQYLSEDPSDPAKTCRVLTIMLAEEY
ncbi:conserved hypothetical protein [Pseudomonas sp. OF001]|uniref:DUF3768 domain-containing protein n=1 Tax=Pseudomonas sp. OF001 TaxID=2772300 RepID=UPI00191A21DC|nr:DUF3768 domain-containing protein [Pseudomonas sp. OF001]CAD5377324.1 conserved hypothetical protein [Pseudomonas sp. OF001]